MPTISRNALLPYPVRGVYDLVNRVDEYPLYMDGCVGAEVLEHNGELMVARLDLQFTLGSGVATAAAGKLFTSVGNSLVDALCKRANDVYGK